MTIEQRGNTYRIREWINGTRISSQPFDHYPNKSEIKAALVEMLARSPRVGDKRTFRECSEDYIQINSAMLSPNTLKEKRGVLRRLPDEFLDTPVCDITEQMVQSMLNDYYSQVNPRTGKPRSSKTIHNLWNDISVILVKYGKKHYDINLPQLQQEDDYFPTEEEVLAIRMYIEGTELEVPYLIAACCGLREGEICALNIEDIKDEKIHISKSMWYDDIAKEWTIKSYPKNKTSNRYVPITKELQTLIYKKGYIYKYSPNRLLKSLHDAQDALGIPRFRFHTLRAFYATMGIYIDVAGKSMQKVCGWSTRATMEKHYEKAPRDRHAAEVKKLNDYFVKFV